ncbi:hypothetical protein CUMW_180700 [Citrus unshiu]|uniref:beta-galactosidase n=1 Tax=Citrus unshiu TaxID=55188 RepID=A0A2H5PYZ3_CITUN|nr:hypothetical protein CUMW_180700 [Citrus unshiu]
MGFVLMSCELGLEAQFACGLKSRYYLEGYYDLLKFIKLVQQAGLYLNLRIGPYDCAKGPGLLKYMPAESVDYNVIREKQEQVNLCDCNS